jgi:hypothetical protein
MERVLINGLDCAVEQFEGIGTLNFQTGRGEVKVSNGEWIVTFPDGSVAVLTNTTMQALSPGVVEKPTPLDLIEPLKMQEISRPTNPKLEASQTGFPAGELDEFGLPVK